MESLYYTLSATFIVTCILLLFKNKSNFPTHYVVPVITSVIMKYILGDWDEGFVWSKSDIQFWATIFLTSYFTTILISKPSSSFSN